MYGTPIAPPPDACKCCMQESIHKHALCFVNGQRIAPKVLWKMAFGRKILCQQPCLPSGWLAVFDRNAELLDMTSAERQHSADHLHIYPCCTRMHAIRRQLATNGFTKSRAALQVPFPCSHLLPSDACTPQEAFPLMSGKGAGTCKLVPPGLPLSDMTPARRELPSHQLGCAHKMVVSTLLCRLEEDQALVRRTPPRHVVCQHTIRHWAG